MPDFNSADYWEERYASGGNSGPGSYGAEAEYKAKFLNDFVVEHNIQGVIEFGCGDGNQLALARYPRYLGLDISTTVLQACIKRFSYDRTKFFSHPAIAAEEQAYADLTISLDVIYHLIEDPVFHLYMSHLFAASTGFVIIYADDVDRDDPAEHVRWRKYTKWISEFEPGWAKYQTVSSADYEDFHVFARASS
jgi:hypothetical protein